MVHHMALNLLLTLRFPNTCRSYCTSISRAPFANGLQSSNFSFDFLPPSSRRCLFLRAEPLLELEPSTSRGNFVENHRNSKFESARPVHTSPSRLRDHVPDIPGTFPVFHPAPNLRLETEQEAEELCFFLKKSERDLLYKVLRQHRKKVNGGAEVQDEHFDLPQKAITTAQVRLLFLCNSLPFIGFGILDNLIMILAGEYIDSTLGVVFGLSTMAAAGFGNIISDIAGVGLAHYVEFAVAKFFDVRPPPLTAEQWDSSKARWTTNSARAFGLTIGCLIGMLPLLFYDETEKQEKKLKTKQQKQESDGGVAV